MIKIITGHSSYGGSTTAFINFTNMMNKNGYDCILYGPHDWHLGKCRSDRLNTCQVTVDDILIFHYFEIPSDIPCKMKLYSVHEYSDIYKLRETKYSLCDKIHYVSDRVRIEQGVESPFFLASNVLEDLKPNKKTTNKVAGVIGTIHPIKNTHISIDKAIKQGYSVKLFGNVGDYTYYNNSVVPYMKVYPNKVKHVGYNENKQLMYDSINAVFHDSKFETWGYVKAECELTGTEYFGNSQTDNTVYMNNDEILEIWKRELGL